MYSCYSLLQLNWTQHEKCSVFGVWTHYYSHVCRSILALFNFSLLALCYWKWIKIRRSRMSCMLENAFLFGDIESGTKYSVQMIRAWNTVQYIQMWAVHITILLSICQGFLWSWDLFLVPNFEFVRNQNHLFGNVGSRKFFLSYALQMIRCTYRINAKTANVAISFGSVNGSDITFSRALKRQHEYCTVMIDCNRIINFCQSLQTFLHIMLARWYTCQACVESED